MKRAHSVPRPGTAAVESARPEDRGIAKTLDAIAAEATAVRAAAHILHDDEAQRALVREVAEAAGFGAECPASVLDLLLANPASPPRLVILAMTAIDDRDVGAVARVRDRWPDVWILVLHPASLRERAANALVLGADATLAEPFYRAELEALARRALARTAAGAAAPLTEPAQAPAAKAAPLTVGWPRSVPAERVALGVAASIRPPVQSLEQELAAAEAGDDLDVASLRAHLRRLSDLADSLTGFAGPPGLQMAPIDVANLVTGVFVSRDVGAAGAEIGVRLGEAGVEILGAADLLRAGLEALRNRAVRVTPPEGKILVKTRNRAEGDARYVEIAVTDGGPALTDDQRASLFEPFADGTDADDGTGLELAALAGIVRAHKGTLLALAAGATGTIVVVRLPMR